VSALDVELPARRPGAVERLVEQVVGATGAVVPVAAVLAALVAGSVLILLEGESPLAVYWAVVEGVLTEPRGLTDTATAATPLILVATGYAVAYRARVFTIGGEGQYLVPMMLI
jgi:simple sugar transport system permease protein